MCLARCVPLIVGCMLLLAAGAQPAGAQAQNYPSRPIKIIVGPSPDIFSRIIAEQLQDVWGQAVVVEPRPGAGGKLAATAVSTAAPDGYTLLFATPTYTLNTAMKLASYDLMKEFEPVAIIGLISYALVVHPSVPAKSVSELVAYAKAHPGGLNCASAGIGTVPHLACELVNKLGGVDIVHVPYRDVNSGMVATMGGVTQVFFGVSTNAKPQIESGALRGLAVSTAQRSLLLPSLPTMADSGFREFVMPGWGGLMAPAGTPKPIIDKLNAAVNDAVKRPDIVKLWTEQGAVPMSMTSEEFDKFLRGDIVKWAEVVKKFDKP
jgi:tripartite-type tricarboxylate transporter receptor subunit TctC